MTKEYEKNQLDDDYGKEEFWPDDENQKERGAGIFLNIMKTDHLQFEIPTIKSDLASTVQKHNFHIDRRINKLIDNHKIKEYENDQKKIMDVCTIL